MTDEQINQRIARACGWKSKEETNGVPWLWVRTKADYTTESSMEPLNYCDDLNAMHEVEKGIENLDLYEKWLEDIWGGTLYLFNATARQRAEAFLRTLGKWSATDKESLTVGATAEDSSVDHFPDVTKKI